MSTLNIYKKIVAFNDTDQTNAPKLQPINWNRSTLNAIPVEAPSTNPYCLYALSTKDIFDGSVTLAYDATTEFTLTLSPLSSSRYRLTWTDGKDPVFRTARTVALDDGDLTITIQSNQTAVVTHEDGAVFSSVVVGDDVFIPGVSTGDTALFSTLNEGHWVVLDASSTQLVLVRETGVVFSGITETVAITDNSQVLIYSSAGVQIDNVVDFVSGFNSSILHTYEIVEVTSSFIEFESSSPLALQTVIPGVNSIVVYDSAKRYIYIESNQELDVTINGVTLPSIIPFQSGNNDYPGIFELSSIIYSLSLTNRSTQQANVVVISVE